MIRNLLMCLFALIITAVSANAQQIIRDYERYYDHDKEYKAQLDEFEKRIKKEPKNASIYFERAKFYEGRYKREEAEKDYSKVISLEPKHKQAFIARAGVNEQLGKYEAAIADYKTVYTLEPGSWIKAQLARLYLAQGDLIAAEENYTIAIELREKEQGRPELYYLQERMRLRSQLGNYEGAVKDCDEILKIDPGQGIYLTSRADMKLNHLKDYKGAVADYNKVLKETPQFSAGLYSRGVAKYKLNDVDAAFMDLLKAGALGNTYNGQQEFYDKLIAERSDDARAWFARGLAKMSAGMYNEAMSDLEAALKYKPKYAEVWFFKGKILIGSANPQKALEALNKAEERGYKKAELYFYRGKAKKMLLDDKGALLEFDKAIKVSVSHGNSWQQRIELKRKMGDHSGAEADQRTYDSLVTEYGYDDIYRTEYF